MLSIFGFFSQRQHEKKFSKEDALVKQYDNAIRWKTLEALALRATIAEARAAKISLAEIAKMQHEYQNLLIEKQNYERKRYNMAV